MSRCGCSSVAASGAAIARSNCISATGAGTPASPFSLAPILDPDARNILTCGGSGLLVPNPEGVGNWANFTPTWTSSSGAAPAIGNGILVGVYRKRGNWLDVIIELVFGSTTSGGGPGVWRLGLPAGNTCGFTSPLSYWGYDTTANAYLIGGAIVVAGENFTTTYDPAGASLGGAALPNGGNRSAGSQYYVGGKVFTTT